jgi:hypothetical protein
METRVFVGVAIVCAVVILVSAATPRENFIENAAAKVLVLSVLTQPQLAAATTPHLRAYCDQHGYDFKTLDTPLDTSRHLAWSKIVLIVRTLAQAHNYEYLVVVDNDVVITNKQIPITAFTHRFQFDANPAQKVLVSEASDSSPFDTGITILKPTATPLLRMLWNLATWPELKPKHWQKDWDNDVLRYYYTHANKPVDILIVPHRTLLSYETAQDPLAIWKEGDFAMRLTAADEGERIKKITALQAYFL